MAGSELGSSGWARRGAVAAGALVLLVSLLVVADGAAVAEVPPAAPGSFTYVRDPATPQSVTVSWAEGPSSGTAVAKWRMSIGDPQGVWRSGGCAHGCGFNYPGTGTWSVPVWSSTLSQKCEVSCVLKLEALSAAGTPSAPAYVVVQPSGARPPQPSFAVETRNPASPAGLAISWAGGAANGTPVSSWKLSQSDGAGGWVTGGYGYTGLGSYPVGSTSATLPTSCQMACLLKLEALGPAGAMSEPTYRFVGPSSARPPQPTVSWSRDPAIPGSVTVSWTPGAANGELLASGAERRHGQLVDVHLYLSRGRHLPGIDDADDVDELCHGVLGASGGAGSGFDAGGCGVSVCRAVECSATSAGRRFGDADSCNGE